MAIKVHELAKELNLSSKEVLEKLGTMGIEAKGHMSALSDIDAIAVRNIMMRGKSEVETKIVKVAPKKTEQIDEPKVVVKAAVIKQPTPPAQTPKKQEISQQERIPLSKPPVGRPVIPKEMDSRPKPPVGTPVIPKDFENRNAAKLEAEAKAEKAKAEAEAVKAEKTKAEAEKAKAEATKADAKKPEPAKAETSKKEASKTETVKAETAKAEASKTETVKLEAAKAESLKPESVKVEVARPEAAKAEQARSDTEKVVQKTEANRSQERKPQANRPQEKTDDRARSSDNRTDRKPQTRYDGSKPRQGDRPQRSDSRPDRTDRTDRPDRPDRPDRADRPARTDNRPDNRQDRPKRDFNNDKPQFATQAKPGVHGKRDDKTARDKDKRDAKSGDIIKKPAKPQFKERTLEKQVRPKKQQKQKPVVVEPEINIEELPVGTKIVNVPITVAGFCEQVEISTATVIMALMKLGIMANINQSIDEDTVLVLAEEVGISVIIGNVEEEVVEEGIEIHEDKEEDLLTRPPIITVMGHVDHGKTSLLDAIRTTNVTASESGGITQHIGASEVKINDQKIVFLDTPGHEAFTAMRARGAHVTDIAVLVVAADDSVKPQTIESISHAKAAGVPVIVTINKIDKPAANIDKVKQDLSTHGILVEDWGGEIICVPVSAKSGEGIITLLEMILLQAEVLELKANPHRLASGTVIEARLDKAKGPVATLLVLNGTLKSGMSVVAGTSSGKIRLMTNFKGDTIKKAGPATAVEILGLTDVPEAGDEFHVVKEDRLAREIAENRKIKLREEILARNASTTLEQLFSQIQEGEVKELNLIIKGDVQGSVGALEASLEKLRNENVRVKIIHSGVGTVTESDVMLAGTAGAVIIGFNVRPSTAVSQMAEREKIEIRTYRVIYDAINDVEAAMKGMLDPIFKEVVLGTLEIRNIFKVPGIGNVGGAYVTDGKIVRNAEVRLIRDGIVIHEGKLTSLKRFKDDVKEVQHGYECGVGLENYNDIKEGDVVECFMMEEIKRD